MCTSYETCLHMHPNHEALALSERDRCIRGLKRRRPPRALNSGALKIFFCLNYVSRIHALYGRNHGFLWQGMAVRSLKFNYKYDFILEWYCFIFFASMFRGSTLTTKM